MENKEPVKRSKEEINDEYTKCCTLIGDKQFKVKYLSLEIAALLERQAQLNHELCESLVVDTPPAPSPETAA